MIHTSSLMLSSSSFFTTTPEGNEKENSNNNEENHFSITNGAKNLERNICVITNMLVSPLQQLSPLSSTSSSSMSMSATISSNSTSSNNEMQTDSNDSSSSVSGGLQSMLLPSLHRHLVCPAPASRLRRRRRKKSFSSLSEFDFDSTMINSSIITEYHTKSITTTLPTATVQAETPPPPLPSSPPSSLLLPTMLCPSSPTTSRYDHSNVQEEVRSEKVQHDHCDGDDGTDDDDGQWMEKEQEQDLREIFVEDPTTNSAEQERSCGDMTPTRRLHKIKRRLFLELATIPSSSEAAALSSSMSSSSSSSSSSS